MKELPVKTKISNTHTHTHTDTHTQGLNREKIVQPKLISTSNDKYIEGGRKGVQLGRIQSTDFHSRLHSP